MTINSKVIQTTINAVWDTEIVPELIEYIKIPNKSPQFDAQWQEHGHMARAVELMTRWAKAQPIKGLHLEVVQLPNRTPLIFMEIPGQSDKTVLLYGHLDKQPEMTGWLEGYGPWQPHLEGDKLYGRGGADDGYAIFASLTAIRALQEQGLPHARCVVVIEACEESGSYDLPFYIDHLQDRIGTPDLVICLDSGCANYDQLWMTTSLRGLVGGELRVELLTEGVHSGSASGIVADSFRVLRQLLSRIEDEKSGKILVEALNVNIPDYRIADAKKVAAILDKTVYTEFPFHKGTQPVETDHAELLLNRTWRPALSIIGCAGLPELENAGNVSRPRTSVMLSMRIPPLCDPEKAAHALKATLEKDPPYGAKVTCNIQKGSVGWNAPASEPWLATACDEASLAYYGKPAAYMGEGGTIPFMGMLGEKFPKAQFMITGVLGPHSNAHGPNEFLHIPMGKGVTYCVAHVLSAHFENKAS